MPSPSWQTQENKDVEAGRGEYTGKKKSPVNQQCCRTGRSQLGCHRPRHLAQGPVCAQEMFAGRTSVLAFIRAGYPGGRRMVMRGHQDRGAIPDGWGEYAGIPFPTCQLAFSDPVGRLHSSPLKRRTPGVMGLTVLLFSRVARALAWPSSRVSRYNMSAM